MNKLSLNTLTSRFYFEIDKDGDLKLIMDRDSSDEEGWAVGYMSKEDGKELLAFLNGWLK